jgi:hypothetical protein
VRVRVVVIGVAGRAIWQTARPGSRPIGGVWITK